MSERRYTDEEVAAIFERASKSSQWKQSYGCLNLFNATTYALTL